MDQKKIGAFIATRRKEKGMTQVQFAEKLGVTNKAVITLNEFSRVKKFQRKTLQQKQRKIY